MPQSFAVLFSAAIITMIFYARHRHAVRKRHQWVAEHRAMVRYLAGVEDEFGRLQ